MTFPSPLIRPRLLLAILSLGICLQGRAQPTGLVEFSASGKIQQGLSLVELAHEMIVIGRDGWLHSLDPRDQTAKIRSLEGRYQPVSASELRNLLRSEFGRNFEVVATKHFLVVQPRGRGQRWPDLFEQSHRTFITYMSKRGVRVRQGRFPMVAIVFPDSTAMYAEFKRLDIDASRVAGLYSNHSNRVMTHDGGQLSSIAATVRHEAAHQSAFNSGVHSRINDTPKWITEGVGQMFEPVAMTDPRGASQLADRVNRSSQRFIQANYRGQNEAKFTQHVMQLVSDDTLFDQHIENAYAVSWAMMFYLAERQPQAFARILNHTSTRPPFQEYQRGDRVSDFEKIVGMDTYQFSKRVSRFLLSL
ncbi:MAG: DUF1570 domain-containing protein [Pirellulales bacterium]|nr:DUF1570 domain-containing protein [Pirellulales bacterium]